MAGPLTTAAAGAFAAVFNIAARLRRGRPLHPAGLLFHAELRTHGTALSWGNPFLDQSMTLHGTARLSRAAGLPPPLPDILGIALRWQQAGASPELLLATTGHTVLGRRLLRPTTRWAPGLYSTLFSYAITPSAVGSSSVGPSVVGPSVVGPSVTDASVTDASAGGSSAADACAGGSSAADGRRVLLAALPRTERPLPARLDALAHALDEAPLPLDLLVAAPAGPWHIFGQITLTAPAMPDAAVPARFNPTRHPIPGLRPAGRLHEVRGPAYAAAQRVPDVAHADRPPALVAPRR
jgi:hypothetical protein